MSASFSDPFPHAFVIVPSDSVAIVADSILMLGVAAGATIKVTTKGGETFTLTMPATAYFGPMILPIQVALVWATGTTAAAGTLLGLYH